MNTLQAAVLGIIQGLTEFLPISSSGHLRVVPAFLGWSDPGAAFSAVVQLGTLAAVLIYFWRDIVRIVWTWLRSLWIPELRADGDARMGWYIGLGTVPVAICGVVFADQIETVARNLWVIAGALIGVGVLMELGEKVGSQKRELYHIRLRDAVIIGCCQAVALIPGSSRSGTTMTGGLFLGLTRETAARFSFLLSIPAVAASGGYELRVIGETGVPGLAPTAVATVFAFLSGYAAIAWLLRFLTRHSFAAFVVYRIALGLAIIGLVTAGVLQAT